MAQDKSAVHSGVGIAMIDAIGNATGTQKRRKRGLMRMTQHVIARPRQTLAIYSLQRHGPACDLGTALECFQGVAEGLGTSLKPFEGFLCGARVKSLQQGPTRDPDQVIDYLRANNDYYNNCDCKEPSLVEKNGGIHIFVTFRESSQKVLEPLTWLGIWAQSEKGPGCVGDDIHNRRETGRASTRTDKVHVILDDREELTPDAV
ncbi:hypothetical protein K438DRAFT_1774068 [Mycena galopus ATCC 62051]|nr:hypothetical protein K438DRAFT_1774068 [Mycena galopus ATCC 62051]